MTSTTEAATPTALPDFAHVAMQRFSPAEQKTITTFADYLEVVIARHAAGRIGDESMSYYLRGTNAPWLGWGISAAIEDAVNAWWAHIRAETGDYDIHTLAPELQHEEVYAERCRADLDDELAELAKAVAR